MLQKYDIQTHMPFKLQAERISLEIKLRSISSMKIAQDFF